METIVVATIFVLLLGLEWRYRLRRLRVGTALLSLVVLALSQPNYTGAQRRALATPPAERITEVEYHGPISAYESGVYTTMREVGGAAGVTANIRLAAVAALVWLACSPALRQPRGLSGEPQLRSVPDAESSEA
jgi:hypothetical protein